MNLSTISKHTVHPSTGSSLRPLPIWLALLFFGLPALIFRLAIYWGMPNMMEAGLTQYQAFIVSFTAPSAILFALAFGFAQQEGGGMSWHDLRARFRLHRMTRQDWLWTVGGFLFAFLAGGMLAGAARQLIAAFPAIAPPAFFPPILDPRVTLSTAVFTDFVGASLVGNWGVFILYAVALFFNIFGEELWWRGLILPRQELAHGRRAWGIHGLLWLLFHVPFYPWAAVSLLPICLTIAYVSQRRQNTTPAIIMHWLYNGLPLLLVLGMVLGLM